ncbi:hypothetical protein DPMN_126129 [Dreissena polymorpha]|uniref:Uncharacterized protein n=1 Tax=Dreissena polymorpha TaxID=45954 RepID=A0A9D4GYZ0_DREPO|nr:hypothetical protein DPMN_126129 [Dreissena polymorpha]
MSSTKTSCVPCCAVISKFQLLMCHEDLETNFMRTLGSANLHDVTSMLSDNKDTSYIVLVSVSSDNWQCLICHPRLACAVHTG